MILWLSPLVKIARNTRAFSSAIAELREDIAGTLLHSVSTLQTLRRVESFLDDRLPAPPVPLPSPETSYVSPPVSPESPLTPLSQLYSGSRRLSLSSWPSPRTPSRTPSPRSSRQSSPRLSPPLAFAMTAPLPPLCHDRNAPRFASDHAGFHSFFSDMAEIKTRCSLTDADAIRWAIRYAGSEANPWEFLPCMKAATPPTLAAFQAEVQAMYPGLDANHRYTTTGRSAFHQKHWQTRQIIVPTALTMRLVVHSPAHWGPAAHQA